MRMHSLHLHVVVAVSVELLFRCRVAIGFVQRVHCFSFAAMPAAAAAVDYNSKMHWMILVAFAVAVVAVAVVTMLT